MVDRDVLARIMRAVEEVERRKGLSVPPSLNSVYASEGGGWPGVTTDDGELVRMPSRLDLDYGTKMPPMMLPSDFERVMAPIYPGFRPVHGAGDSGGNERSDEAPKPSSAVSAGPAAPSASTDTAAGASGSSVLSALSGTSSSAVPDLAGSKSGDPSDEERDIWKDLESAGFKEQAERELAGVTDPEARREILEAWNDVLDDPASIEAIATQLDRLKKTVVDGIITPMSDQVARLVRALASRMSGSSSTSGTGTGETTVSTTEETLSTEEAERLLKDYAINTYIDDNLGSGMGEHERVELWGELLELAKNAGSFAGGQEAMAVAMRKMIMKGSDVVDDIMNSNDRLDSLSHSFGPHVDNDVRSVAITSALDKIRRTDGQTHAEFAKDVEVMLRQLHDARVFEYSGLKEPADSALRKAMYVFNNPNSKGNPDKIAKLGRFLNDLHEKAVMMRRGAAVDNGVVADSVTRALKDLKKTDDISRTDYARQVKDALDALTANNVMGGEIADMANRVSEAATLVIGNPRARETNNRVNAIVNGVSSMLTMADDFRTSGYKNALEAVWGLD
eukprot:jgi/Mesvir1/17784/Mv04395-RA.1